MTRPSEIARFVEAQAGGEYEGALAEIRAGRKRGHWIWYTFPQIAGLGTSHMSQAYAIHDRSEAEEYLRHPLLSQRLLEIASAAADHLRNGVALNTLMGSSIDAAKLVSSMTLFGEVARHAASAVRGQRRLTPWRTRRKRYSRPPRRRAIRAASTPFNR